MTTLFGMNNHPGRQALRLILWIFIAFIIVFPSFNTSADTERDNPVTIQAAAEVVGPDEQERARQRELIAESFLHEKLKMKTDIRDLNNAKRAAGEILGFDVFLGAFLTVLWAMISLFIATQFSGDKNNGKNGVTLFNVSAAFVPLILLGVAISTGYVSWWLSLAVSGLVYWLMGFVFKKMKISATGSI